MSFQDLILTALNDNFNVPRKNVPLVDVVNNDNTFDIYFEIPGVKKDTISIDFCNNKIDVSGEKIKKYNGDSNSVLINERVYGPFIRRFTLPISVINKESVIIDYTDGVLHISIDKNMELSTSFSMSI